MSNISVSIEFNLKDLISEQLNKVAESMQGIVTKASQVGQKASESMKGIENASDKVKTSAEKITDALKDTGEEAVSSGKKTKESFGGVEESGKDAEKAVDKLKVSVSGLRAVDLNSILQLSDRFGEMFTEAGEKGLSFNQSMADLSSITGIVGDDLEQLKEKSREFGKESGLGADNTARAYSILASQIQVADIGMNGLNELAEKSIKLAEASGMTIDNAANSLAGTINQFGLGADQAGRVINVLAAGSKYGAAEIVDLSESFKVVGAAASAMGLNVEQTAGALEVLSKANLKGSESGTALRNIILKLNTMLNVDLTKTSLSSALDALKPKLSDATYLSKIFGMENIAAAQFLIKNSEAVDKMTASVTNTNVAEEQAAIRTETSAHKMEVMKAQINDIKIGLTDLTGSFAPYIMIVSENAANIAALVSIFGQLKGVMLTVKEVTVACTSATAIHAATTKVVAAATKTWEAVQMAMNAVLSANPIAVVIMAVSALVAAVIYAYNHFEGFRQVCDKVWMAVKNVASAVWNFLVKAFQKASAVIKEAWEWVKNFFGISDDPVKKSTESVQENTEAIEQNAATKKKNANIDLSLDGNKKKKKPSPKGSLGYLDEQIEKQEKKVDKSIDPESRTKLYQELQEMKEKRAELEIELTLPEGSINKLEAQIQAKQTKLSLAVNQEDRIRIQSEIDELTNKKNVISFELENKQDVDKVIGKLGTEAQKNLLAMVNRPKAYEKEVETKYNGKQIQAIDDLKTPVKNLNTYQKVIDETRKKQERMTSGIYSIGNAFSSLGRSIGGQAGQWLEWGGNVAQATAQAISAIMTLLPVQKTSTVAAQAEAGSKAADSVAGIPIVGAAMAIAAVASVMAAFASLPKFAAGGLAYGPTLGIFGEYAGASNNPEVVAPLDKLQNIIGTGGRNDGTVKFHIEGRTLVGILNKMNHITRRTT